MLNGKGVDKRCGLSMVCAFRLFLGYLFEVLTILQVNCLLQLFQDTGPQCPTNVTSLLNAGSNLLQTIGCFGGFCSIDILDIIFVSSSHLQR